MNANVLAPGSAAASAAPTGRIGISFVCFGCFVVNNNRRETTKYTKSVLKAEPDMRAETDKVKLESFMAALGQRVRGQERIYLTGGATAVLHGWRTMTIDIDLKPDPEPPGLFEALAILKDELDVNVKLASPDQFIPAIPGWRERSLFIARHGLIEFFHYDPYGQALSKLQRRHDRDLRDVRSLMQEGLVRADRLREMFALIEPDIIRFPAIDPASFRTAVIEFCQSEPRRDEQE